jgi:YVTN family beta-propeller protein
MSSGEGAVWVANGHEGTVTRIDLATNTVVETIAVGRAPFSIAVGEGAVWVTNREEDTLTRIDPAGA